MALKYWAMKDREERGYCEGLRRNDCLCIAWESGVSV
jgi:hypothetical protein